MAEKIQTIASMPSPKRLIEALRDVGYDFHGAVADIIDNSIAAEATEVDVQVHWDGPDSWVRISDNGFGMDSATITEALRVGSERSYRTDDLGKFGLGLKTASLSQCRDITVASRTSKTIRRIEARRFDLDRIIKKNKWEIEDLPSSFRGGELVDPLKSGPGTVVLWTKLDRLTAYRTPHGDRAKNALWDMVQKLEEHLGMVFHRFIEGNHGGRHKKPVVIKVNGNHVAPWSPFAPNEGATQHFQKHELIIAENGVAGLVSFDPYVLPAKEKFSSEAEFNRLSGPSKWNQQQGFYIYRANRMIQSGGWSRLRAPDEHTKLARVALDFFPDLDDAFGLNIAKMRVNLPTQLREQLRDPIEALIREAKKAYNPKTPNLRPKAGPAKPVVVLGEITPATKPDLPSTSPQSASSAKKFPTTTAPDFQWPPPTLQLVYRARPALEDAATAVGETAALERIVERLQATSPEVSRGLGWD